MTLKLNCNNLAAGLPKLAFIDESRTEMPAIDEICEMSFLGVT